MSAAARHTGAADGVLRVGIPLELPADLLARPWQCSPPSTPIPGSSPNTCPRAPSSRSWRPVSSTSAWFANIRWAATGMRSGSSVKSSAFSSPPRSVRSWPVPTESAVDAGPRTSDASLLMGDVKLAAVAGGDMFAFAPPNWSQPIPESVCRQPWGHPLVRPAWAAWPADSHRRDLGKLHRRTRRYRRHHVAPLADHDCAAYQRHKRYRWPAGLIPASSMLWPVAATSRTTSLRKVLP